MSSSIGLAAMVYWFGDHLRRVASKWIVVSCAATVVGVAACASIFGVTGGNLLDGGTDGAADAASDYVTYDGIDLDVNTAICDGGSTLSDAAIWVSPTGSNTSSCGDQTTPCQTIAYALANLGGRNAIYLDNSTFNEAVTITSPSLTLQGGFVRPSDAGGWTEECNSELTTIQAPDDAGA